MTMDAGEISKKKRVLFFTGMSALLLVVVACTCGSLPSLPGVGGSGGAATPTLISLDGSTDGGSGGEDGGFNFVDPTKSGLDSYHAKITMTYTGTREDGTPASGTFLMEQWHTSDPLANRYLMEGEGAAITAENAGKRDMVTIGDLTYVITQVDGVDKCLSMQSDITQGMSAEGYSPSTFLTSGDMSGARRILPDEVVNGILSQHWQFTKSDVELLTPGYTSYTVDAWTAVDGGYAVKSILVGDGENISLVGGPGHVEWEFNLIEANIPITIEAPAGCEAPAGSDLPKMADAENLMTFEGTVAYQSASSVADVTAFYTSEMPAAGWTAGEVTTEGATTMIFTKDGQTATILIMDTGGKTQVTIQVQ